MHIRLYRHERTALLFANPPAVNEPRIARTGEVLHAGAAHRRVESCLRSEVQSEKFTFGDPSAEIAHWIRVKKGFRVRSTDFERTAQAAKIETTWRTVAITYRIYVSQKKGFPFFWFRREKQRRFRITKK